MTLKKNEILQSVSAADTQTKSSHDQELHA